VALRNRARSTRLLVVTLVSVSLVTITVDYREGSGGPLDALGDAAVTIITPLQEAVSNVTHPIGNFFSTLVRLPSIRSENERLRNEIASLEQRTAVALADQRRLAELEGLLDLQQSFSDKIQTEAAAVISNGVSNFEWTITINKGSNDGLAVDMPVVSSAGLVGHIVRTTPTASFVQLIIDPKSSVAAQIDTSGESGAVEGQGDNDLRMAFVSPDVDVEPNGRIVTAGFQFSTGDERFQSLYPPNILIGTVSRVLTEADALTQAVSVRPAVDFSNLSLVLVVTSDGTA
jgi:rod shape-determining protein MreC